ncbi:MAG TPA: 1-phosphofructokinase family hexose kinase [Firmicutes bacterium]|nr:1-phosphofructokinase family hexose kinase [Bacillota bacterium]
MITVVTLNPALDKYYLLPGFGLAGVHRVKEMKVLPSGKGINVARVLARFGVPVQVTGVVAGYTGQRICHELDRLGIPHDMLWCESGESRQCLLVMDCWSPAHSIHTEILEPGPPLSEKVLADLTAKVGELAGEDNWVVLSGSPPDHVPDDYYASLIKAAHARGAKTLVDVRGKWLAAAVAAGPAVIKPNLQEFEELVGPCPSVDAVRTAARRLVEKHGIKLIIISRGQEASLVVTADSSWLVEPPQVPVISAVGCGDTLVGGFLAGLHREMTLIDAICLGTAAASASACRIGAGEFAGDEARRLRPFVQCKCLNQ